MSLVWTVKLLIIWNEYDKVKLLLMCTLYRFEQLVDAPDGAMDGESIQEPHVMSVQV